jgi:hypothetical protein
MDVVVAPADIKLGKIARALEFIDEFWGQRKWGGVFNGDVVQEAVVLDGAEFLVFLFDKKE